MGARALAVLTGQPWAIEPSWLPLLAAIATRDYSADVVQAARASRPLAGARTAIDRDGVAVIPVFGPIFPRANLMSEISGATSIQVLENDLRAALANPDTSAVMFAVDSPGGAVSGVSELADLIYRARKTKPVHAYVSGAAASAAYWLASQASEIIVEQTALLGSIGVATVMSQQVQPDSDGRMDVEIVSTNAPNKRPDLASDEGVAETRRVLDAIESIFIGDVSRGRRVTAGTVRSDFGQGGVLVGNAAVAAGMADRVSTFEASLNTLARSARAGRRARELAQ